MTDTAAIKARADMLRETTEAMANRASVDMDLWNRHSNACLATSRDILALIERVETLEAENRELKMSQPLYTRRMALAENERLKAALGAFLDRHILYCGGEGLPFSGQSDRDLIKQARAALNHSDPHTAAPSSLG